MLSDWTKKFQICLKKQKNKGVSEMRSFHLVPQIFLQAKRKEENRKWLSLLLSFLSSESLQIVTCGIREEKWEEIYVGGAVGGPQRGATVDN